MAMGIAVVVLNIIDELQIKDATSMLGIGLFCIGLSLISKHKDQDESKTLRKTK